MSFYKYLEEKRFLLLTLFLIVAFVTLMMILSTDGSYPISDILYTSLGCASLATIYIISGYFSNKSFYQVLEAHVNNEWKEVVAVLPKPQTYEQELYMRLLLKQYQGHLSELEKLHNEKKDHQDFILSWIHEVKLPITASRLLFKNSKGKTIEYLVDKFEDELNEIDHYVEQALYYSRIDSFSKDYFITEVSLISIVRESIKKYAKLFINKHIRFTMWEAEHFVHSDSKWLRFVIDQIVTNSLKYTPVGGSISFEFEEDSKEKRLVIQDTGIGIKAEDLGRVFEKGFTGSIGRTHSKSTGMGLYLAKQLASKLGHSLSIQSEENKYTRVTIHFPKIRNYLGF